jgi:hypothetical protein
MDEQQSVTLGSKATSGTTLEKQYDWGIFTQEELSAYDSSSKKRDYVVIAISALFSMALSVSMICGSAHVLLTSISSREQSFSDNLHVQKNPRASTDIEWLIKENWQGSDVPHGDIGDTLVWGDYLITLNSLSRTDDAYSTPWLIDFTIASNQSDNLLLYPLEQTRWHGCVPVFDETHIRFDCFGADAYFVPSEEAPRTDILVSESSIKMIIRAKNRPSVIECYPAHAFSIWDYEPVLRWYLE